jgi:hypothetical protein
MADQTGAAVDLLLGLLSTAIKDEAQLLKGIQGDMQFINDEMHSMNGFLQHLIKMESEHDDQLRAWMKQVREVSYIAKDCVQVYMSDIDPLQVSSYCSCAYLLKLHKIILTWPKRHRLAKKVKQLKVRVREVGERRQRYDVTVRSMQARKKWVADKGGADEDARREAFLDALLGPRRHEDDEGRRAGTVAINVDQAIRHLPPQLQSRAAASMIRAIAKKCTPPLKEMLLRVLYAYPPAPGTTTELEKLKNSTHNEEQDPNEQVKIFCYSRLPTDYKSCLQYLTAFQQEDMISRTSMVRRWLAEDLVARDPEGTTKLEDAGEKCFRQLEFLGYLSPLGKGAAGKLRHCKMDGTIKKFVEDMSRSENFVNQLPYHLDKQVAIRKIVRKQMQQPPPEDDTHHKCMLTAACCCGLCTTRGFSTAMVAERKEDPLDDMVDLLKNIKVGNKFYRLNVLDLGGCKGMRSHHLETICMVRSLKYLSLRNTGIPVLPSKQINNLIRLETLDMRQTDTDIQVKGDISLPKLKHLLAGRAYRVSRSTDERQPPPLFTSIPMPSKIARMKDMEIISHVQFNHGSDNPLDLPEFIRKLGVFLTGKPTQTINHLLRAVSKSSDSLHSLSISWPATKNQSVPLTLDMAETDPRPRFLETLNINGHLGNNGLPNWCQSLNMLSKVTLCETKLQAVQALMILGKLQALCCLRLRRNSFVEVILRFTPGSFRNLRFLLIEDTNINSIDFQATTSPKLEKITWWNFTNTDSDLKSFSQTVLLGMDHLPLLKLVEFNPGRRYFYAPTKGLFGFRTIGEGLSSLPRSLGI